MHTSAEENLSASTAHKRSTPQSMLLEINREFNVPVDQLFNAFTSAEALKIGGGRRVFILIILRSIFAKVGNTL
jgi:hypothetical protein